MLQTIAVLSVVLIGCKKGERKSEPPPADDGGPSKPTADAAVKTASMTRLFSCEFVDWKGTGAAREAQFALTNRGPRPVSRLQTWIYYYSDGAQVDRYPHALAQTFEPAARVELSLGFKGLDIKHGSEAPACEVTEATFADGETWSNLNLNYNGMMIPRPVGGETHEQLLARTGTAVQASWTGNTEGMARFKLANVKGRPLRVRTAWVYYYDADGRQLGRAVTTLSLELAAGASAEQELGYKTGSIPEDTKVIEATISSVELTDTNERWINRNLESFERPMQTKPPEPATDAGAKPE